MKNLKIGFIGYGRHAQANLYPSLRHLGYSIQAVATSHEESAKKAALDYSIPNVYTDYKKMLVEEKLDCVFICAKPNQELQLVKDTLGAHVHVFVEKNLGGDAGEAKEVADLCASVGKHVTVGFMKRFGPVFLKLHDVIQDARFGEIISLQQTFACRNFVSSSKEYLLAATIHYIDLLRYYLGEITQVKGFEKVLGDTLSLSFSLKAENGTVASLYYSASPSWVRGVQEMTITGSNGFARVNGIDDIQYHFLDTRSETLGWKTIEEQVVKQTSMLTTGGGGMQSLYLNGFIGEVAAFLKSVEDDTLPTNNEIENVKTMQLCDAMAESLK